jgi:hypothetical protein
MSPTSQLRRARAPRIALPIGILAALLLSLAAVAAARAATLPGPWLDTNVGSSSPAGSASYSGGVFTIKGAGVDIFGTYDQFNYVYQSASGDGTLVARVTSETNAGSTNDKAGVMWKASTASGSPYILIETNYQGVVKVQANFNDSVSVGTYSSSNLWMKLVRSGSNFSAYVSSDGVTWTTVVANKNLTSIPTASTVGIFECSHKAGVLGSATFDNVAFAGASGTGTPAPTVTATPTATPTPSPTASPTPKPTATPTPSPTASPTPKPTATPTPSPTASPTASPTPKPTATPTPSPTASPTMGPTPPPSGFLGHSGTQFTLDGRPFTFTGFNIYQANSRGNCSYTMGTGGALDTALNSIGSGSEVFRAWFFQSLATTNGQRDWSAFDHTLAVAKAHGVKVIVTLGNQWGSCESGGYKTDAWYTGGYKTTVGSLETVTYRQWVADVVSHYKNDPTIAMWQLMNEAEIKTSKSASTCAPTADLYNFAADVSGLIKSIDSNHLVNLGTMGAGQCGSQGSDYAHLGSIPTIDVLEYHDYGHDSTALPTNLANDVAASKALGKPIFVGEAGIQVNSGGSTPTRASEFDAKCTAQLGAGVGGFLVWSWNNSPSSPLSWEVGPGDPTLEVIDSY